MRTKAPLFLLICLGLLLVGCGTDASSSGSSVPTVTAAASAAGVPTSTIWAGTVTLRTNTLLYRVNDTISVTINSQSDQTIYFPDHLTNCTVILMQRQAAQAQASDQGRTGINPCKLMTPTRIHSLGPGQSLVVKLIAPRQGWPAGLYEATLNYSLSMTNGPSKTINTGAFVIGNAGSRS